MSSSLARQLLIDTTTAGPRKHTYIVLMDNGMTQDVLFKDLLVPSDLSGDAPTEPVANPFQGLPFFLARGSKITMDHVGAFKNEYLGYIEEGGLSV